MTVSEFASLLGAKRIGKGRYLARCPAHADKRPSLSIAEGRKQPIIFKCMSQGCTQDEVLKAMGLTWKDLLGERPKQSPEVRARLRDEQTLRELKAIRRKLIVTNFQLEQSEMAELGHPVCIVVNTRPFGVEELEFQIIALENRMYPEKKAIRQRDAKTAKFVKRWGWDKLWELFLSTKEGKELDAEYGL